jgi:hypothetical protein
MNWWKILSFSLATLTAICNLFLSKIERPFLTGLIIFIILAGLGIGIYLEHEDTVKSVEKDKKLDELVRGKDRLISQNKELLLKVEKYQNDLKLKEEKIQELEKIAAPRILSVEQKSKLIKMLSFTSEFQIIIACRAFDQESLNYAEEFAEIFRKANWRVGPTNRSYLDNVEGDVAIVVTDDRQRETASKIAYILNTNGIDCRPQKIRENSISGVQSGTIYLIVGSKLKDK